MGGLRMPRGETWTVRPELLAGDDLSGEVDKKYFDGVTRVSRRRVLDSAI